MSLAWLSAGPTWGRDEEGTEGEFLFPVLCIDVCKKIFNTITAIKYVERDFWIGYEVTTYRQTIALSIDNCRECYEVYGVNCEQSDKFIGAEVFAVRWTYEKDLPRIKAREHVNVAGLDISTSRGLLRLWAFNDHNGYYPHSVRAQWLGKREKICLWL